MRVVLRLLVLVAPLVSATPAAAQWKSIGDVSRPAADGQTLT